MLHIIILSYYYFWNYFFCSEAENQDFVDLA